LTDEFQRHEIKEAIINREIREKRNNWLEIAETGLRSLELTAIAGTAKVMTNAAREMQLARLLVESRATQIRWGMWEDLPKAIHNGKEYAKIGKYFYSKHAIDHMSFGARDAVIPSHIPGQLPVKMRGIPSIAVEETLLYGRSQISIDQTGQQALEHVLGDIKVHTTLDKTVVISVRKEVPK
jgi:hypothetical protein